MYLTVKETQHPQNAYSFCSPTGRSSRGQNKKSMNFSQVSTFIIQCRQKNSIKFLHDFLKKNYSFSLKITKIQKKNVQLEQNRLYSIPNSPPQKQKNRAQDCARFFSILYFVTRTISLSAAYSRPSAVCTVILMLSALVPSGRLPRLTTVGLPTAPRNGRSLIT